MGLDLESFYQLIMTMTTELPDLLNVSIETSFFRDGYDDAGVRHVSSHHSLHVGAPPFSHANQLLGKKGFLLTGSHFVEVLQDGCHLAEKHICQTSGVCAANAVCQKN